MEAFYEWLQAFREEAFANGDSILYDETPSTDKDQGYVMGYRDAVDHILGALEDEFI